MGKTGPVLTPLIHSYLYEVLACPWGLNSQTPLFLLYRHWGRLGPIFQSAALYHGHTAAAQAKLTIFSGSNGCPASTVSLAGHVVET